MYLWYFFMAVGALAFAAGFFFAAFAMWSSARTDSDYSPRPVLVTLNVLGGLVSVAACLWLLSL